MERARDGDREDSLGAKKINSLSSTGIKIPDFSKCVSSSGVCSKEMYIPVNFKHSSSCGCVN